jgi:ribonuclease HII
MIQQLTEKLREKLFDQIITKALTYSVSIVDHDVIDEVNILNATMLAMKQAVDGLNIKPDLVIVDGNRKFVSDFLSNY